jgi:hypothetical protein
LAYLNEDANGLSEELMGIDVIWQSEFGNKLDSMGDPNSHLPHLLERTDIGSTCCLRFIDRYGDTVFNRYQIPTLIEELENIKSEISDPAQMTFYRELLQFIKKREDLIHIYLKFIGD